MNERVELTVSDLLTRNVLTVSPETTLADAAKLMTDKHYSCMIAVQDGKPVGILTESDLVRIGYLQIDPATRGIAEFLSQPVIAVEINQSIYEAFDFLLTHRVRHLVAVQPDGQLEGILTFSDILKAAEFDDFLRVKKISSVMSRKLMTLKPDDTVHKALEVMVSLHISCVLVVEGGRGVGIFTERDAANLVAEGTDLAPLLLSEVMVSPLKTTDENDALLDAYLLMREHGLRRLVIVDEQGHPSGLITQFDVIRGMEGNTVRHYKKLHTEVEDKLAKSHELLAEKSELERIVGISPAVLYRCEWDPEEKVFIPVWVSDAITKMLGYDQHECLHKDGRLSHVHPDDRQKVLAEMASLLEKGELEHSYRFLNKSGDPVWVRDHMRLTKDEDGLPLEIIGSMLDMSQARHSDDQYRSLFNDALDMIQIIDAEGRITDINPAALERLGYAREEMIGRSMFDLSHFKNADDCRQCFAKLGGNCPNIGCERLLESRAGEKIWVEVSASAQLDAAGNIISVREIMHDITQRKIAGEASRASEQRLQTILMDSPVPTVVNRLSDGEVLFFNAEAKLMFGLADDQDVLGLFSPQMYVHSDEQAEIVSSLESSGMFKGELEMRRLNGDNIWVLVSARTMQFGDEKASISLLIDTTAQRSLEMQFRQAQKMESVGTLVGGIAHDFNNMLAGMLGQLYLVRHELESKDFDADYIVHAVERIREVENQGRLAAEVIAQLMTFARKGQVVMERLDVNRLVADAMRLHRVAIPENITMNAHLGDTLEVVGDVGMIQQVLLNLLTNARDALEDRPRPHIDISLFRFEPNTAFLKAHTEFEDIDYACLAVQDNGCGMSKQQIDRIFDPFFTTKPVGKGTGLGLSMLYGAIQTHYGHVLVDSTPGEGTCFSLYFPLLDDAGDIEEKAADVLVRGGGQCILLADDEKGLLEVISHSLKLIGYRVMTVYNGEEAVRCFTDNSDQIDLIMLDVVMPVKGGVDAAHEIRKFDDDVPIIFHTGYGDEVKLNELQIFEHYEIVKKPANIERLSAIIADLLDQGSN